VTCQKCNFPKHKVTDPLILDVRATVLRDIFLQAPYPTDWLTSSLIIWRTEPSDHHPHILKTLQFMVCNRRLLLSHHVHGTDGTQRLGTLHQLLWRNCCLTEHKLNKAGGNVLYVYRNVESRSCNHCYGGKTISITYCECVSVALVMQHAMRMRPAVISGLSDCTIFFSTLSHKWHDFRKRVTEYKMCVVIFSATFVWKSFHFKKNLEKYDKNGYWTPCKVPVILVRF